MKMKWLCLLLAFSLLCASLAACGSFYDTSMKEVNFGGAEMTFRPSESDIVHMTDVVTAFETDSYPYETGIIPPAITQPVGTGSGSSVENMSYDDIIDLYSIAVDHLGVYCKEDPESTIYADAIADADQATKETYASIFLVAYAFYESYFSNGYQSNFINAYGYAVFDVDKDGSDELVLMSDECDILAIFKTTAQNKTKLMLYNKDLRQYYIGSDGSINYGSYNRIYYAEMTKSQVQFEFVRLTGDLVLQKPYLISWDWCNGDNMTPTTVEMSITGALTKSSFHLYIYGISVTAKRDGDVAYFEHEEVIGRVEFCSRSVWLIIEKSNTNKISEGAHLLKNLSYAKG